MCFEDLEYSDTSVRVPTPSSSIEHFDELVTPHSWVPIFERKETG